MAGKLETIAWKIKIPTLQQTPASSIQSIHFHKSAKSVDWTSRQVEMENQEQQRILEESLAAGAELKEKCMVEQQELSRLKQIWSDTQPELFPGFAPKRMDTRRSS